jgi:hypothetical protein
LSKSNIPEKVKVILWGKSAGRCEFNGCNKIVYRDWLTRTELNFSQVAHIIGDSPDGPRGDVELSKEYCCDIANLMLMCPDHHKTIDSILDTYTDDVLRQMKLAHEVRIEQLTELKEDQISTVVIYEGRIGQFQPNINDRDCYQAMFPRWYPAPRMPIRLGLSNSSFHDHEKEYWQFEEANLERQFSEKIKPLFDKDESRHFSVFAFAPQPLLIKLGSLFSDIYGAEVYQLHREPQNWKWQPEPENFEYIIEEPRTVHRTVAINLSLSATVRNNRISKALGTKDVSFWNLSIDNPNNDFLKSHEQIQKFREVFRILLNKIKARHGENQVLHIFTACPVSIAVEIGRVWQPKADLPLIIYDQNRHLGGFAQTFSIGMKKTGSK